MLPTKGRKLQTTKKEFATEIANALCRDLGNSHRAIKTLMRWTGASERSAKNWLTSATMPSGQHLILLMCHSDEVLQAVLLLACRGDVIPSVHLRGLRDQLAEAVRQIDAAHGARDAVIEVPVANLTRH